MQDRLACWDRLLMIVKSLSCTPSGISAPLLASVFLKLAVSLQPLAKSTINSANVFSEMPKWFSSSAAAGRLSSHSLG